VDDKEEKAQEIKPDQEVLQMAEKLLEYAYLLLRSGRWSR